MRHSIYARALRRSTRNTGLNGALKDSFRDLTVPARTAERSGKASLLLGTETPSSLDSDRARCIASQPAGAGSANAVKMSRSVSR
jgi:hypothetical protein